ncbi:MAG: thermonuclease family protein [Sphingomonadaceae bacterium]|nr:thermonuclease family protein [Sphingomonadaceae bacterium]
MWQLPSSGGDWQESSTRFTLCGEKGSGQCVIDGDTLAIGRRKVRLAGYDAPELDGACEAERKLAQRAKAELRDWLNAAPYALDGGDDPPRDKYGRELRSARRMVDGKEEWLADHMIGAGLARDNGWGAGPARWCEQQ